MRQNSGGSRSGRMTTTAAAALAVAVALALGGCDENGGDPVPVKPGEEARIDNGPPKTYEVDFAPFALLAEPAFGGDAFDAKLLLDGQAVDASGRGFVYINPRKVVADFPLPSCRTLPVEMFSGGANCCFTYYILTACGEGEGTPALYASYIDTNGKSSMGDPEALQNGQISRVFPITDPAFQYYTPRGQSDDNPLFLPGVDSPAVTRFLIFDENIWRPDQTGRHPEAYAILISEARNNPDMHPAAKAIAIAYYTAMMGDQSLTVLEQLLPPDWARFADVINADILDAIEAFEPVKTIDLHR